ncbi:MAG TPA: hypothetical protein VHP37_06910 [Burkholderiales bacterium]|nr:hypothetical protein [Burkholderiales bacterium]
MAKCIDCELDMSTADGCGIEVVVYPDGSTLPAVPWQGPRRCRDCNAAPGFVHHWNCCVERCPQCGRQLISCPCDTVKPVVH